MLKGKFILSKITKSFNFLKLTAKSFRGTGYDRQNFPDNRIRTGIEVSPYTPQFTLTEEEKIGKFTLTYRK
jgi:hypothetical protein